MVRFPDWFRLILAGPLTLILIGGRTVTVALASGTLAALAWMSAVPAATLVTMNPMVLDPPGSVTLGKTVAAAVLVDERLNVIPPGGAGADNVRLMVPCTLLPVI